MAQEFRPLILIAGLLRLSAADQLREDARDARRGGRDAAWSTWRISPDWSPGRSSLGDEDPIPHAHLVTTTTHKSLRGPAGGLVLATKEYSDSVDRGLPAGPWRAARPLIAPKRWHSPRRGTKSSGVRASGRGQRQRPWLTAYCGAARSWSPADTDNHLAADRCVNVRPDRRGRPRRRCWMQGLSRTGNAVPADPNGAWYTSGVRIGTPALTTRGFGAESSTR
jgi:glycine hydroxymethyltransferase